MLDRARHLMAGSDAGVSRPSRPRVPACSARSSRGLEALLDVALMERRPDLSAPVRAGDLILRLGREKCSAGAEPEKRLAVK